MPVRLAVAVACAVTFATPATIAPAQRDGPTDSEIVGRMSLDRQIGQLLVGAFGGTALPRSMRAALRDGRLSGVILFGANVRSPAQLRALTRATQQAATGRALISVDQEGGSVRRIPFADPRSAQRTHGSPRRVQRIARRAATDLARLGVNVNFAPVADVPASARADIFPRAFGGGVSQIGAKTAAAIRGYRAGRVAATAKHFPGLGAAPRNTDDAPVVIRRSRRRLDAVDLAPFRAAVKARAPLMMIAHARYPALDPRNLASRSKPVIEGLLRDRMGFRGVAVTDALEAAAATRGTTVARAAERSLLAGCDLLLLSDPSSHGAVFARLRATARRSPSVRRRIAEAATRVTALKRSLGLY